MFSEYQWKAAVYNAYAGNGTVIGDSAIFWTGTELVVGSRYNRSPNYKLLHVANKTYAEAPSYKTALAIARNP
jgi:hypothetical protein